MLECPRWTGPRTQSIRRPLRSKRGAPVGAPSLRRRCRPDCRSSNRPNLVGPCPPVRHPPAGLSRRVDNKPPLPSLVPNCYEPLPARNPDGGRRPPQIASSPRSPQPPRKTLALLSGGNPQNSRRVSRSRGSLHFAQKRTFSPKQTESPHLGSCWSTSGGRPWRTQLRTPVVVPPFDRL